MEMSTAISEINWLAVILAAISAFLIGCLWYEPLFGRAWMREVGFEEEDLKYRNVAKDFWFFSLAVIYCGPKFGQVHWPRSYGVFRSDGRYFSQVWVWSLPLLGLSIYLK